MLFVAVTAKCVIVSVVKAIAKFVALNKKDIAARESLWMMFVAYVFMTSLSVFLLEQCVNAIVNASVSSAYLAVLWKMHICTLRLFIK